MLPYFLLKQLELNVIKAILLDFQHILFIVINGKIKVIKICFVGGKRKTPPLTTSVFTEYTNILL